MKRLVPAFFSLFTFFIFLLFYFFTFFRTFVPTNDQHYEDKTTTYLAIYGISILLIRTKSCD